MTVRWLTCCMLMGAMFIGAGCLQVATAPLRAEANKKGEDAMARLAAASPETIASFLDERMNETLSLSPEVQPRVAAINLSYATKSRDVAAGSDRLRAKLSKLKSLEAQKQEELKRLLSPEQLKTYREEKEKMRARLRERFGEASAP